MTRIANEMAALATMSLAQLRERWVEVEGTGTSALPPLILRRLLAQRLQERKFGGLSATVVRELERASRGEAASPQQQAVPLTPGARLVRELNSQEQTWRSLSEIAREVTGAHWSGPRFFGLNRRG